MNYNSYLGNLFASTSQLLHALAGGDRDVAMSSMCYVGEYELLRKLIDFTFEPVDGKDHCKKSYERDILEDYSKKPNTIALHVFVIVNCLLLNVIFVPKRIVNFIYENQTR